MVSVSRPILDGVGGINVFSNNRLGAAYNSACCCRSCAYDSWWNAVGATGMYGEGEGAGRGEGEGKGARPDEGGKYDPNGEYVGDKYDRKAESPPPPTTGVPGNPRGAALVAVAPVGMGVGKGTR